MEIKSKWSATCICIGCWLVQVIALVFWIFNICMRQRFARLKTVLIVFESKLPDDYCEWNSRLRPTLPRCPKPSEEDIYDILKWHIQSKPLEFPNGNATKLEELCTILWHIVCGWLWGSFQSLNSNSKIVKTLLFRAHHS